MQQARFFLVLLGLGILTLALAQGSSLSGVGFATPESVLHDEAADVYLVSNISGAPLEENGDGFISRVSPDGTVLALRWIDGAAEGITLNAPKGMAIAGNTLYVADIHAVRMFDRESGTTLGSIAIAGSSFLNDVAAGPDGMIYVTDTGLDAAFEPTGTDAIYRIDADGNVETVIASTDLANPNGVTVLENGDLFVVTFGPSGAVYRVRDGSMEDEQALAVNQLDGVVALPNGDFLISSWGASSVVRVTPAGELSPVAEDVAAPADIGYDRTRNRLLIPRFMDDEVLFVPLAEN